ncbi:eukaryotic translation initiation factor 4B isoform X2 [Bacillus rossius redtenbacheri]|uniref:eukaryotic translation initiation factor 4B isoform X2 n=1 Tax=Bacillus rossius redtenbacheri TaxID=93214 RepID=UPI002FDD0020
MAASGKKGKKTKGKTVPLNSFLADTPGGLPQSVVPRKSSNWADDVDNDEELSYNTRKAMVLPTAPRATRSPDVDDERIPHSPPFLAYISNLPYEVNEDEIADFFQDLQIVNVRLPRDDRQAGKLKGFGYVEFGSRDSLISALTMGDTMIKQRRMRIEVADNTENDRRRGGRDRDRDRDRDGPDRSSTDWRAGPRDDFSGPDPDRDRGGLDRRGGGSSRRDFGSGGFREGDRGFGGDRDRGFGGDRDRGFGGDRDRSFGGDRDRGFGGDRDRGFGGDRDRGFGGDRDRGFGGDRDRGFGSRDGDRDRGFGSRDGDRDRGFGSRDGDRDRGFGSRDGGRDFGSRPGGSFGPRRDFDRDGRGREDFPPPRSDGESKGRQRLNLMPRTRPVEEGVRPPPPAPTQASIFGAAKPVDTAAREREIEERLAREKGDVSSRPPPRDPSRSDDSRAKRGSEHGDSDEAQDHRKSPMEPRSGPTAASDGRVSSPQSSDPEPEHAHRTREESPGRKYEPPRESRAVPRRQNEPEEGRDDHANAPRGQQSKSGDRSRPRDTSEPKKDAAPTAESMPKLREQEAPVFVARNKFDFLADEGEEEGAGDPEEQQ